MENEQPLNEFITLQRGFDLPKSDRVEGGIPVVASTSVGGYHNIAKVKAPGVVIGRSGSIGGGQYVIQDFWPLNTTLWVKDFKGHNPRYVYYLFKSIDFSVFNVGSGVPTLNRNHLSSLMVNDYGRTFEDKVAKILGDLDDKLTHNHQTNQTLEQMAQTLFKSWFVDFDPVFDNLLAKVNFKLENLPSDFPESLLTRAEIRLLALNSKEHEKTKVALTSSEQSQASYHIHFPSEFEYNEQQGWIPKGWDVKTFKQVIDKYIDNRGKTPPLVEKGIPLIEVKHIPNKSNFPNFNSIKQFSLDTYNTWFRAHVEEKDILISTVGTIGRTSFVKDVNFGIAQNILGLRFGKSTTPEYMFYYIKSHRFQHDMDARLITTVQASIKRKDLDTISILVPSKLAQSKFSEIIESSLSQQFSRTLQSEQLTKLRDTLLPKLISGGLQIPDLESPDEKIP